MANPNARVQMGTTPYSDTIRKWPLAATATTYYPGEMIGLDSSGNAAHLDDTDFFIFAGISSNGVHIVVDSGGSAGDKHIDVDRPLHFSMPIAAAVASDIGRKVYAAFSGTASYSPGTYANEVGRVLYVLSATEILIAPPWSPLYSTGGSYKNVYSAAAAAATTLTSRNLGQIILLPLTSSETINLPAVATCSPGDRILFINTSANSSVPTLDGNASETINGATTFAMPGTQYSSVELVTDGTAWYVDIPNSGTLGATTFTARAKAALLAVGPAPTDTYSSGMTIDVTKSLHVIAGVNGTSATSTLTPSAAGSAGDILTILTAADASGTVTVTFASTFHSSGTQATTASHFSSIVFESDGTRWYEVCRTTNLA